MPKNHNQLEELTWRSFSNDCTLFSLLCIWREKCKGL